MRRKRAEPREIPPDPKYGSVLVQKLINCVMWDGKKRLAEKIVYKAFELIEKRTNQNALTVFETALENVKPIMEVRPRRVGGATYQVPVPVPPESFHECDQMLTANEMASAMKKAKAIADLADEDLVDVAGQLPKAERDENIVDFPRIEWREELQQFAGMCQHVPGQHPACNQNPGGS